VVEEDVFAIAVESVKKVKDKISDPNGRVTLEDSDTFARKYFKKLAFLTFCSDSS
jgi:hypothetical protein